MLEMRKYILCDTLEVHTSTRLVWVKVQPVTTKHDVGIDFRFESGKTFNGTAWCLLLAHCQQEALQKTDPSCLQNGEIVDQSIRHL